MTVDEFLQLVGSEPAITIEREVTVHGPEARALLGTGRTVPLLEFLNHPDRHSEIRTFRYGHLLGAGLDSVAIDEWQAKFPEHRLPPDLRDFLMHVNGIELWADLAHGAAYFGILPLQRWTDARLAPFAQVFDAPPKAALVLSHAEDGAGWVVLDTLGPAYRWCDLGGAPKLIGDSVADLLEHWWKKGRLHPSQ